jgi:TP901 family phage tail tape measure protein
VGDYNLGTASGKIKVEYDGSGVAKATKSLTDLSKTQTGMRQGFKQTAAVSGAAASALAGGIALAVNKAIDFEKQISAIGAVSGASNAQLETLRKKALQLGADTVFSASDAAGAMEELAKAGVPLEGILNGAADATVALAAAGGIALPKAAEIAANAMNSFRLSAEDMPRVSDLIAGAANASSISVEDFGQSLQQVGAVAGLVRATFDDTAVAIALMGKVGIKGSDAGTSLKTMFLNLQPQTKKQIALFRELGLTTANGANQFFDAQGKVKSLADVSQTLQNALKGQTQQQKLATLEMLFGSDAIRAAAVLSENGAAGFNDMATAMGKVKAADVAKARLDNVAGSIEQMKGSLETAAITVGSIFLPTLRTIVDFITNLVNKFSALDPRWQKLIVFASLAAAALLGLISVVAAIGFAITGITATFAALSGAAVVVGIVAGLVALGAAIFIVWQRSEAFRAALTSVFTGLVNAAREIGGAFAPFVNFVRNTLIPMLVGGLKKAIDNMKPAFESISNFMQNRVVPAAAQLRAALDAAMPTIIKVATFVGGALAGSFAVMGKVLGFIIPLLFNIIGPIFSAMIAGISFMIRAIPTFVAVLLQIWNVMRIIGEAITFALIAPLLVMAGIWRAVWGFIGPLVTGVFNTLVAIAGAGWAILRAIFSAALNFIMPLVSGAMNFISSAISVAMNIVSAIISGAMSFVRSSIAFTMNNIVPIVQGAWNFVTSIVSGAVERVKAAIAGIGVILGMVRGFFNGLQSAASGGVGSLISFVGGIPGRIVGALSNLAGLLVQKGRDLIQGLLNGINGMVSELLGRAANIAHQISDTISKALDIGSPSRVTMEIGRFVTLGLAVGIEQEADQVRAALQAAVANALSALPADHSAAVAQATNGTALSNGLAAGLAPPVVVAGAGGPQINQTFNVPEPTSPASIAAYSARRLNMALAAGGART